MFSTPPPLILTLHLDQASFARLDALRQQYFPPQRNIVPAHVTLFHALPGAHEEQIHDDLAAICSATPPVDLFFPGVRSLGRGVALDVRSPALVEVRGRLAARWSAWLGAQDQQRYRPHVTIQNKVTPQAAKDLFEQLSATWRPFAAQGEGLALWRYVGGPWEHVATFAFAHTSEA